MLKMPRRCQERETYGLVSDKMMDVVAALPPANGQAAAKVGNEHANQGIDDKYMGNGSMASIVGREHDLMLYDGACQQVCLSMHLKKN